MIWSDDHQAKAVQVARAMVGDALLHVMISAQAGNEIPQYLCPVVAAKMFVPRQIAPYLSLPTARVLGRGFAVLPAGKHVGAIDQVFVEYSGQLACELPAAHL